MSIHRWDRIEFYSVFIVNILFNFNIRKTLLVGHVLSLSSRITECILV